VLNAVSPALTCALPFAQFVVSRLLDNPNTESLSMFSLPDEDRTAALKSRSR
jgi:hypothetical protein